MIRLSAMASSAMGLASGVVATAVPLALEVTPFNSIATGATAAFGVGMTSYSLWQNHGQSYLAKYIATAIDTALKGQKEAIHQAVADSVKSKLPTMIASHSLVENGIKSVVNSSIDNYATDPEVVRKALDDLDRHIPYENNEVLSGLVNQATESILEANCTGIYKPLQPYLRKPLARIVATAATHFLKVATETAVTKAKESPVGTAFNNVDLLGLMHTQLGIA